MGLCRDPEFSTKCKAPVYGGDSACPPEPPLRFCDCVVVPSLELSFRGGATAAGAGALPAKAPKSVEKNSVRISTKPKMDTLMKGFPYSEKHRKGPG